MAAAKKKAKVKRKKSPAAKPVVRKKSKPLKKAPARKPAARRAAPKKQPAARPAPRPRPAAIPPVPPRGPLPGEERVGFVTHYYGHLSVAAIRLESGSLRVGDTIRILGHTSDFRQRVESMQVEHQPVTGFLAGAFLRLTLAFGFLFAAAMAFSLRYAGSQS